MRRKNKLFLTCLVICVMIFGQIFPSLQASAMITADAADVQQAKEALEIGFSGDDSASSVTGSLTLPESGLNECSISWVSDDEITISNTGVVTRPSFLTGDKKVVLTATIRKNETFDTKDFELTVLKNDITDAEAVQADKDSLEIGFAQGDSVYSVTNDVSLPTGGTYETVISWASSDESVITTTGSVNRPTAGKGDKVVTLTATISKGIFSLTKEFALTVKETTDYSEFNGHYYGIIKRSLTWAQAYNDAQALTCEGKQGHLAAITSTEEEAFIESFGDVGDLWLGGYQEAGGSEPADNWEWITGETWDYNNWSTYEPNNAGNEDKLMYWSNTGKWNDINKSNINAGYIVEFDEEECTGQAQITAEVESIKLGYSNGDSFDSVTGNITLPVTGIYGRAIYWSSDNSDLIDINSDGNLGIVTRPDFQDGDGHVVLTATINAGSSVIQNEFELTVKKLDAAKYNGHYYAVINKNVTWTEAKAYANSMFRNGVRGHLAMITSAEENAFVSALGNTIYHWLGGFQPVGSVEPGGNWQWLSDEEWNYSNWDSFQPDNMHDGEGENALEYFTVDGYWNDASRDLVRDGFIIEFDNAGYSNICEFNGHYYAIIDKDISWENAKKEAESLVHNGVRGHLATITTEDEDNFVVGLSNSDYHWLGGKRLSQGGGPAEGWTWINEDTWDYTNWLDGQPDNGADVENCLQYWTGGFWNDAAATDMQGGYIVEFDGEGKSAQDIVAADKEELEIGFNGADSYDEVTSDLILPDTGAYGSIIIWTSSNDSIVDAYGHVARPKLKDGDQQVTLTALITYEGISDTREFTVTVLKDDSNRYLYNGHYYEVIDKDITWEDAKIEAQSLTQNGVHGHLATISSAEENNAIVSFGNIDGHWLGGFQPDGSPEPDGNWRWLTTEGWSYANWQSGEPNNAGNENALVYWSSDGKWNDWGSSETGSGYVVEFEGPNPQVMSSDPMNNALDVIQDKSIKLFFDKEIFAGDAFNSITLQDASHQTVAIDKSINGLELTIKPSKNLNFATLYTVTIPAEAVKSAADYIMSADYSFSFTTENDYVSFTDQEGKVHYYQAINKRITWNDALLEAKSFTHNGVQGHLATITSAEENDFVAGLGDMSYHWLGGIQPDGSPEPEGNWQWVTGEDWSYTNWDGWQPDNYNNNEMALEFFSNGSSWNDAPRGSDRYEADVAGYIVEFDDTAPLAAPEVTCTDPADGSTGVNQDQAIKVTFNVYISQGEAIKDITLKDAANNPIAFEKSLNDKELTITPSTCLGYGTVYTVTIPAHAVQNIAGDYPAADYSFSFTSVDKWDTIAPSITQITPANAVTIGGNSNTRIQVTATDNDTFMGATALIEVSSNGTDWQNVGTVQGPIDNGSGGFSFYSDWNLQSVASGEYTVRCTVTDRSDNNTQQTVIYQVDRTAPTVPSGLTADFDAGGIRLDWQAPPEADVNSYKIYRKTDSDSEFGYLNTVSGRSTVTYTDGSVQAGQVYHYIVTAVDKFNQESPPSNTADISIANDNVNPVVLGIEPVDGTVIGTHAGITIRAQDNFILSAITLQYSAGGSGAWTDIATINTHDNATFTWDASALTGEVKIRAIARDFVGNISDGTPERSYTIDTTGPEKITGVTAMASTTSIMLKWNDVSDQDFSYFQIEKKDSQNGEYQSIGTTGDHLWFNATGLSPEVPYWFRIVAYDTYGNRGTPSDEVEAITVNDTTDPSITGLGPNPAAYANSIPLSGSAQDNVGVSAFTFQYSIDDGATWQDISTITLPEVPANANVSYTWDVTGIAEGMVYVRGVAVDAAGNSSDTSAGASKVQYKIDRTAPATPSGFNLTVTSGDIRLTWSQGTETDLAYCQVYRSVNDESNYVLYANNLQSLSYLDSDVEPGKTYYYKVAAADSAGNISALSSPLSGVLQSDTEKPIIRSLSPAAGSTLPANPNVGAWATDNHKLAQISMEYLKEGDSNWTELGTKTVDVNSDVAIFTWNTTGLTGGSYTLRATAVDKAGNTSDPSTITYNLDVIPPATPVLTAAPGGWKVSLSWSSGNESDLAGFRLYRSTTTGGPYKMIAQLSKTQTSYMDEPQNPAYTYYYVVEALDGYNNVSRSTEAAAKPSADDPFAPTAAAGDDQIATVNMEAAFDGTQSNDNDRIASYSWNFGDGGTSSLAQPTHTYTAVGQYTVTLTVTDPAGNTATDTAVVTVKEAAQVGTLEVLVVDDTSGTVLADASVVIQFPDGTMQKFTTNGYGKATVAVSTAGEFKVYAYKTDYKPASADASIILNKKTTATVRLPKGQLVVGQLNVRRLTLEEITAAGIDTSAPENQFVYKFEVHLAFNNVELPVNTFVVNGAGNFVGTYQPISIPAGTGGGGGSNTGGSCIAYPVVIPNVVHPEVRPTVAYLVIPGEARWLKEFFEVGLTLENTADPQFVIQDSQATLNLPDGLALAPTKVPQSLTVDLGSIAGQETREVKWIIRGDKSGEYNLQAKFSGILKPFDDPVSATFSTASPFKVWGNQAIKMHVDAQERADKGYPYHVRFGIENVSDIPIYNVAIELKDDTKQNYIYAPNQELEKMVGELPAGQTFWADYWLIPSITGHLDLSQSYVLKTGVDDVSIPTVITSRSDPQNYPPTAPVLHEVNNSNGTVTLSWDAVSGISGYRIYAIRSDLSMSKQPDELVYTAGAAETSVTLQEANGPKDYIIMTLTSSGELTSELLQHAITGLSWCGDAENPVITIDPMQVNVGQANDLMITVNSQGLPVKQGTVDIGSYLTGQVLDDNGQVRVSITPTVAGDIVVSAYDKDHNFLVSKTIQAIGQVQPVQVTGVSLDKTTDTIIVGGTDRLRAIITPADATNTDVTWRSDNPDVAKVDQTGLVTAVSAGTANITVTTADGGYTATCAMTVNKAEPVKYILKVINGTGSGSFNPGATVTVAAVLNGKKFGGWQDEAGNIINYNQRYSFIITRNTTLTAILSDTPAVVQPTVTLDKNVTYDTTDPAYVTMKILGTFIAPTGYQMVECGFISIKNPPSEPGRSLTLETAGATKVKATAMNQAGQVYRQIKTTYGATFYVRGYLTYKNTATGETVTIYSADIVKAVKTK